MIRSDWLIKWLPGLLAFVIMLNFAQPIASGQQATGVKKNETAAGTDGRSGCASCSQAVSLLKQQKKFMAREMAQLKRELALLRTSISEPGLKEVFAGIGYILGLIGIGFFVHCRNKYKR